MTAPTVYLAGPIRHVSDDGRTWREDLKASRGDEVQFLDPLDLDIDWHDDGTVPVDVVPGDLELIDQADVVLASLPHHTPSRGTAAEVWEAGRNRQAPVVVLADVPPNEYSPFVRGPATAIVQTLPTAMDAVFAIHAGDGLNPDWTDFHGADVGLGDDVGRQPNAQVTDPDGSVWRTTSQQEADGGNDR